MKQTPRRAENVVAQQLSDFFVSLGLDPVERQPVTGRTGPDITLNDFKLCVDVKSRLEIPNAWLAGKDEAIVGDGMIGWRISHIGKLETLRRRETKSSVIVRRYLEHQHEWTMQKCKLGISAIALRRPGLISTSTTLIILASQESLWLQRISQYQKIMAS